MATSSLAALLRELEGTVEEEQAAAAVQMREWLIRHHPIQRPRLMRVDVLGGWSVAAVLTIAAVMWCCTVASSLSCHAYANLGRPPAPSTPKVHAGASVQSVLSSIETPVQRRHADVSTQVQLFPHHYPAHSAFERPIDALRRLRPDRQTSDFPLILCVGHGKSGTKSLNRALLMLGYRSAHFFGAGVYGLLYGKAAEVHNHNFTFEPVDAVLDTPVVDFYNEILLTYPNARVILSIRSVKSWLRSQQRFYSEYANGCAKWPAPWRHGANLVFGTECPSPEQAVKRYTQHNRNVFDAVPREQLLIMDIPGGDGWEKLCGFLGKPVPNDLFPSRH